MSVSPIVSNIWNTFIGPKFSVLYLFIPHRDLLARLSIAVVFLFHRTIKPAKLILILMTAL